MNASKRYPFSRGRIDAAIVAILAAYLLTEIFAGPLRFYLSQVGAAALVYLPKALVVATVLVGGLLWIHVGRANTLIITTVVLLSVFVGVGALFAPSIARPAFGAFVLVPLIYAMQSEPAFTRLGNRLLPYIALLWAAVAIGVALDYFSDVPWTGAAYQLGDVEVEGSRDWSTFGLERVAGFARASYEAADQLLILALPLVLLSRWKLAKVLLWLITGLLIAVTTTKKTAATYLLLTLFFPVFGFGMVPAWAKTYCRIVLPIIIAVIGIALPASVLLMDYTLDLDSFVSQFLFASFEDRLTLVWPASLSLAFEHGSTFLGRGIGGIGTAQNYFEPSLYMPGDSLYVYLYVTFGVTAFVLIGLYVSWLSRLRAEVDAQDRLMWFLGIAVLMNGWANNGVESAIMAIAIGLTFSYAYTRHAKSREKRHIPQGNPAGSVSRISSSL